MSKKLLLTFLSLSTLIFSKTEYTGDKFLGKEIITNLDVTDLEEGKVYEFLFQATENSIGQPWLIPVTVVKGKDKGQKFLLNAGIHGNEVNTILAAHKVKAKLDPKNVNGTITIIHGINTPGLLNNTRGFSYGGGAESTTDLNRITNIGKNTSSAEKYSTLVWNNLLSKNADMVIDLHTNGRGNQFPLFAYADFRNSTIKKMAELSGSDVVKLDGGEKGTIETAFVEAGIPSFAYEIGAALRQQPEYVNRAVNGVLNNLIHWKYLDMDIIPTEIETFYGNSWARIRAEKGGHVENMELLQV